ncbi:MAG TPA: DUF4926 domain-containing protein [Candidatus Kapabacteria bacterium]|nr:DUF4926 domain-containing protein [Candidatus Kapabacteria bacterium]
MRYELYKDVALAVDIPEHNFEKGDIATVVDYLTAQDNGEPGLALEFFNTLGETVEVLFVPESSVEPLAADEIWHARHFAEAA